MLKLSKLLFLCLSFILVLAACSSNTNQGNNTDLPLEDLASSNDDIELVDDEELAELEESEEILDEESFELSPDEYVGSSLEELIPTFQTIISSVETPQIEYDFDGDGHLDIAVVLEDTEIQEGNDSLNRTLLVAFGMGDGTYHFPDYYDNIVLGAEDGGVMGDPFMGLSLNEEFGTFGVSHYGGSNFRWSNTYHINYLEQGWSIVGYSGENFNASDLASEIIEFDLQMGEIYIEVDDGEGNKETFFPTKPVGGEILLYDFNSDEFSQYIGEILENK